MTSLSPADAERLKLAFQRCREIEGSLNEQLQAYAAAGREIFPAYSEAVDSLVVRINENGGGENAPRPGEPMPPFVMIKDIPDNLARAMARRNVEVIKGHGIFAGPDAVQIGDRTLHAGHIVIAAGSKPRPLPIPGAEHMVTSDEMLSESQRPESIVFIGGGVISLEFGHVYARR